MSQINSLSGYRGNGELGVNDRLLEFVFENVTLKTCIITTI